MTVRELIKALSEFDEDMEVRFDTCIISGVEIDDDYEPSVVNVY